MDYIQVGQKQEKVILETAGLVWLEQRGWLPAWTEDGERKGPFLPPALWKLLWKALGSSGRVLRGCVYERQDLNCTLEKYFLLGPWVRKGARVEAGRTVEKHVNRGMLGAVTAVGAGAVGNGV